MDDNNRAKLEQDSLIALIEKRDKDVREGTGDELTPRMFAAQCISVIDGVRSND